MRSSIVFLVLVCIMLAVAMVLGQSPTASSATDVLYVRPAGLESGNCANWVNACDLQYALTSAASSTEIWVARGVYTPGMALSSTFQLKSNVAIYGGFAMTETARDQRNWKVNITVLSGDLDGNDVTDASGIVTNTDNITGSNAYHVVRGALWDSTATLDGLVITAGQANSNSFDYGGGMDNHVSSPSLFNIIFSGNRASYGGGGMNNDLSSPMLTNVTFSGNRAGDGGGGGMFNGSNSAPTLVNVMFNGNQATYGGGMSNWGASPTLMEVVFISNQATYGGGMRNSEPTSHPALTNVTISNNHAEFGGGIYNERSSSLSLTNVTFSGNQATDHGGGIYNWSNSSALTHVTFISNVASVGGGMYNRAANLTAVDITFSVNQAADFGGGMYNYESNHVMRNVVFSGNHARGGGGLENWSSSSTLTNATFIGNQAGSLGGGVNNVLGSFILTNGIFSGNRAGLGGGMFTDEGSPILTNVTFSGNRASSGGGLYNVSAMSTLVNCIVWGNSADTAPEIYNGASPATISYSDIRGEYPGTGNIDRNPLFMAPIAASLAPTTTGNYRLSGCSAAINAGSNSAAIANVDLDGRPRVLGSVVDMGAYETPVDVCKAVTPTTNVPVHGVVTYTIKLTNYGDSDEVSTVFTDVLPGALSFGTWVEQPAGAAVSNDIVARTGVLSAHTMLTLTFTAVHVGTFGDVVSNTAEYSGSLAQVSTVTFSVHPGSPPVASAGGPQTVKSAALVTLDGSSSSSPEGKLPLVFGWVQSGGIPVVLSNSAISRTTFTAPTIFTQTTALTFTLVVTDSVELASQPAQIIVAVEPYRTYLPMTLKQ